MLNVNVTETLCTIYRTRMFHWFWFNHNRDKHDHGNVFATGGGVNRAIFYIKLQYHTRLYVTGDVNREVPLLFLSHNDVDKF